MPFTIIISPNVTTPQGKIIPDATESNYGVMTPAQVKLLDSLKPGSSSGFISVEFFRKPGWSDYQTCQAALDSGVPLLWPQRTYTMGVGQTLINTECHVMIGADTTWMLGADSTVNTDADSDNFTPFMQVEGVQDFAMLGRFTIDGNRDNQTYPATVNNFGRGTATLPAAGRRTNATVIFCASADNVTPTRHVRIVGDISVQNGYLNGLCFWQTEDVLVNGVRTANNTINGISLGGVKGFRAEGCFHYRDGVSAIYTSTRSGGDRAGIQAREMPASFTAAALGMPSIPVPVSGQNEPNYDVSIIGCSAEECQAESWFLRCVFPGKISNCTSKNVGYQRNPTGAPFFAAHYWGESGWYQFNNLDAYQTTDNDAAGWQRPDVMVCATFDGIGANGTGDAAPLNINGGFKSNVSNVRAVSGEDGSGNAFHNFNRGCRIYSGCTVSSVYVQGTRTASLTSTAEGIRIENDTNWNTLPPRDVQLYNIELRDLDSPFAIEINRFGGAGVTGTSSNLVVRDLIVRGMTTTLSGTDDHAIIDFASTMAAYPTTGLRLTGLDIDGTNGVSAATYNGVRLRQNESSENMHVDFARAFNTFTPVRSFGFQGLRITGEIDTAQRIAVMDFGTNTADSGKFSCNVYTTGIVAELFNVQNMGTFKFSEFVVEEGCVFNGGNLCRTFPAGTGGITTTPNSFFSEAKKFIWNSEFNNYGASSPGTFVYDMRRTFSDSTNLKLATPYYNGELVLTVDTTPSIVWMGTTNRTAGAWAQQSGAP